MRRILFLRNPRPHGKLRRASYGLAVNIICNADDCSLPLSARSCGTSPLADRLTMKKKRECFSVWAAKVTAVTAFPLGEPTILCSRMDESIIVGYYTSAEVLPRNPGLSQIPSERRMLHGKK